LGFSSTCTHSTGCGRAIAKNPRNVGVKLVSVGGWPSIHSAWQRGHGQFGLPGPAMRVMPCGSRREQVEFCQWGQVMD